MSSLCDLSRLTTTGETLMMITETSLFQSTIPEQITLNDMPSLVLFQIMKNYLSTHHLRNLRLISHRLKSHVDQITCFKVPLNNTSLRWVKSCSPLINTLNVGILTNPDFQTWMENMFPEVETVICNNSAIEESNVQKLFQVFPNVKNLCLKNLTTKELTELLELKMEKNCQTLNRNKVYCETLLIKPKWDQLRSLELILNKVPEGIGNAFGLFVKRKYSELRHVNFELRLQGCFKGNYAELHPIYISWIQFIASHSNQLKKVTFFHDLGLDINTNLVLEDPTDNLDLMDHESQRYKSLNENLHNMKLDTLHLKPHFHESFCRPAWNWNWKLLESQHSITHMILDFTDNPKSREPELIRPIIWNLSSVLKHLEYTASSDRSADGAGLAFDLGMFKECKELLTLEVSRGWSRHSIEWGPAILFDNVDSLPKNICVLKLRTENARFQQLDAIWVSQELTHLKELTLPICMNKSLVTNLLNQKTLEKFTLVRDYFSEIKIRDMVAFCEKTKGMSYYCPEIQCYDPSGRWLELLIITVMVDRKVFKFGDDLVGRFPGVLLPNQNSLS